MTTRRVALLGLAAVLLLVNLGGPRLWDRDEPRNAGCAAEMMARGDWVTPVFNGELRTHKPVLTYWLMISAYQLGGVTEWTARIWSALLGLGSVALTAMMARRFFGERAACWSGVSLATMLMFQVASRAATPDAALIFFSTAAIAVFVLGRRQAPSSDEGAPAGLEQMPSDRLVVAGMYALTGLGVLTKGPVGLVLPCAVIGLYLLLLRLPKRSIDEEPSHSRVRSAIFRLARAFAPLHFLRTCWLMRPLTALVVVGLVAAPWYVWVGLRTDGQWLRGFFLEHNLGRALHPMEGHGGSSLLYYPAALWVGAFPWSLLLPGSLAAVASWNLTPRERAGLLLSGCWVGVYVAVFSIARTKLPSYITPCYPGLALLVGWFCAGCEMQQFAVRRRWALIASGALAACGLSLLIALPLASQRVLPGVGWLGVIGLIPLVGGAACARLAALNQSRPWIVAFTITAATLVLAVFGAAVNIVNAQRGLEPMLQLVRQRGDAPLAVFDVLEPSWVFYTRRQIHLTSLQPQLSPPAISPAGAEVPTHHDVEHFMSASPDALLITRSDKLTRLQQETSVEWEVLAESPFFLRQGKHLLVLRAKKPAVERQARQSAPTRSRLLY